MHEKRHYKCILSTFWCISI